MTTLSHRALGPDKKAAEMSDSGEGDVVRVTQPGNLDGCQPLAGSLAET